MLTIATSWALSASPCGNIYYLCLSKISETDWLITRSVAAGFSQQCMPPPASNDTGTALDQDSSDWSHDLATLTFDLGGRGICGWRESSSSIRVPSLKFVGLAILKIWHMMCVSINGLGDHDLWSFGIETGVRFTSKLGNLPSKLGHAIIIIIIIKCIYVAQDREKLQMRWLTVTNGTGMS